MTESTPGVSVRFYLAGLGAAIVLGTLAYAFVLAPLLFGDPAWVSDGSAPDNQLRATGRGITLPTLVGIAFVTVCAVGHGWLYVNYPHLLDR
ncbi:hypothetical protein [Halorubellus sp. PRR65]|uniref:hypothetical protein n=1 Tax=Halorubellus sp. PRR65 TaxID=3098148 RepID=UPI002B25C9C4|nr:hypothetical protein [Halorubellus sp. PRR65]